MASIADSFISLSIKECPRVLPQPEFLPQVTPGLGGVPSTGEGCVEFAVPGGGEEEGKEEVLRRLVTPRGRRI